MPENLEKPPPIPDTGGEKQEEQKPTKKVFGKTSQAKENGLLDDKGRYKTHELEGYDPKEHVPPKKDEFAEEFHFMRFRADQLEKQAADCVERAAKLRKQADFNEKHPDERKRNAVRRMARMRQTYQDLMEELKREGIEVDTEDLELDLS
jgi:hypothetical protein